IPYDGRARQFISRDWSEFDYILAMDESNLAGMMRLKPHPDAHAEAKLFLSDANADKTTSIAQVPDPYYTGKYDQTYDLVIIGAKALLKAIRKKHGI
ncbi:MAG: low molecular weight phosphotyrosine protein phosphatase, partial [Anaerolineae bacterium]|nr:low molecular weight phosphotyrosine protein phosphatase [Anaerolineae bacterium]